MKPCIVTTPETFHKFAPDQVIQDYSLIFADHFDQLPGTLPSPARWDTSLPWGPTVIINNEEQYYTDVLNGDVAAPNPFDFDGNSNLIIKAGLNSDAQRAATGQQYYSGVLTGFTQTPFRYGYIESRIKLPAGNQGLWSAFWLLNRYYSPSPLATGANGKRETEIDWEFVRGPGGAFGGGPYDTLSAPIAYHYDNGAWTIDGNGFTGPGGAPGLSQQCDGTLILNVQGLQYASLPNGADLANNFHIYGIWWEEDFIRWYLDGVEVGSICDANIVSQIDMYCILNQAVGGAFPGMANPADYADEVEMLVDYVCILQKNGTAQPVADVADDKPVKEWVMAEGSRCPVPVY